MYVFCLEGNYGIGKSTLFNKIKHMKECKDFYFINEGFMELYNKEMDPNGIITELNWVSSWFRRIIELKDKKDKNVVIADRSPYSALFFTKSSKEALKGIINDAINELKNYGIIVITIHLNTKIDVNWDRVITRLEKEPNRAAFNEDNYEKFNKIYNMYNEFKWDHEIINDENVTYNVLKCVNNFI